MRSQPGVLDERRLPARQVARRAVPEPAAPELDVDSLRDGEFSQRALDEAEVRARVAGDAARVDQLPAARAERGQILLVARVDLEGDPKTRIDPPGELEETAELVRAEAEAPAPIVDPI